MGRGCERPITCMTVGCGHVYTHKRMDSKGWKRERMLHVASGDCARRINKSKEKEVASRGTGISRGDVLVMLEPIYVLLRKVDAKVEELKDRVAKRLESRKSKAYYKQRDAKPKAWKMRDCIKELKETDADVVQSFRDIMTKDLDGGWSWQRALQLWFHWLLDQCSSDPILLMAKDEVRYHMKAGVQKATKLRFFRCFAGKKDWDPLDEDEGFFVGFWYPLVRACRNMVHWTNWIMYELPITEQQKRQVEVIWHDDRYDQREPNLERDRSTAQVFYDVLAQRKDRRRDARMEDEKEQL